MLSFLLCAFVNLWAQDVIVTKKGEEILAKVEEIGDTQIKYKKFSHLSGPIYSLLKSEIFMIKYENGSRDVFDTNSATSAQKTDNTANSAAPNSGNLSNDQGRVELLEAVGKYVINRSGRLLSKDEVRSVLAIAPEALPLYDTGLSNIKTGHTWGWISMGCLVGGSALIIAGAASGTTDDYGDPIMPGYAYAGLGLVVGGVVCMIPWATFTISGKNKIDSAVDIYNSAAIKRQHKSDVSLNFGVTRSGGIGLTLKF